MKGDTGTQCSVATGREHGCRPAGLLYDHLDFVHGMEAFINAFPGASMAAMRQGFLDNGWRRLWPDEGSSPGAATAVP